MLRQVTDGVYEVQEGKQTFNVAFLPGSIAIYGTVGHQFFRNEDNFRPDQIFRIFKSEEAFTRRAELHRVGTTNKERFNASLDKLFAERKITETQRKNLRAFIAGCDCLPPAIRKKLEMRGYADVAPLIEFEDLHPEFEATRDAFKLFLKYVTPRQGG